MFRDILDKKQMKTAYAAMIISEVKQQIEIFVNKVGPMIWDCYKRIEEERELLREKEDQKKEQEGGEDEEGEEDDEEEDDGEEVAEN